MTRYWYRRVLGEYDLVFISLASILLSMNGQRKRKDVDEKGIIKKLEYIVAFFDLHWMIGVKKV